MIKATRYSTLVREYIMCSMVLQEARAEDAAEEAARAERKRRQRQAQEEFRLKQLMKQKEIG